MNQKFKKYIIILLSIFGLVLSGLGFLLPLNKYDALEIQATDCDAPLTIFILFCLVAVIALINVILSIKSRKIYVAVSVSGIIIGSIMFILSVGELVRIYQYQHTKNYLEECEVDMTIPNKISEEQAIGIAMKVAEKESFQDPQAGQRLIKDNVWEIDIVSKTLKDAYLHVRINAETGEVINIKHDSRA